MITVGEALGDAQLPAQCLLLVERHVSHANVRAYDARLRTARRERLERRAALVLAEALRRGDDSAAAAARRELDALAVAATAGAGWPEPQPLPPERPAVAPFDLDLLPAVFAPWVGDIADRLQCPPDFPAVASIVALAAVVGRQVAIRPKRRDTWTVVSNLWGTVVERPGLMKRPALEEPMRPLLRLEVAARHRHEAALSEFEAAKLVAVEARKEGAKAIRQAIKEGGGAHSVAADVLAEEGEAPVRRRYIANDSSVEKLGELLAANPRGVLLFRDELTGFLRAPSCPSRSSDWTRSTPMPSAPNGRTTACPSCAAGVSLTQPADVLAAVHYLANLDWLQVERIETRGRPTTRVRINPKAIER